MSNDDTVSARTSFWRTGLTRPSRLLALAGGIALLGVAAFITTAGLATPAGVAKPSPSAGDNPSSVSLLYTLSAASGTLEASPTSPDEMLLTLAATDDQVLWFSDAPARHAGVLPTTGLVTDWADLGFADSPPNAALSLHHGAPESDTVVVELGEPRFDPATGVFSATVTVLADEGRKGAAGKNLDAHLAAADDSVPASFAEVTLFIDDATGRVVNGCLLQPYTVCESADLAAVDLSGANLTAADLLGGNLTGANLTGANLTGANLTGANLTGANLTNANLTGTDFTGANLTNANLTGANISGTIFTGANTTGMILPAAAASGFCTIAGISKAIAPGVLAQSFSSPDASGRGTITLVGPAGQTLTGTYACATQATTAGSSGPTGAWTISISGSSGTLSTPVPGLSLSGIGLSGTITKSATGVPVWSVTSQSQLAYRGITATGTFSATGINNWTETVTGAGGQFTDADGTTFSSTTGAGTVTFAGGVVSGAINVSAAGNHKMIAAIPGRWTQSAILTLTFSKTAKSAAAADISAAFALTADSDTNHIALAGQWSPTGYALTGSGTLSVRGALVRLTGSYQSAGFTTSFGAVLTAPHWDLSGSAAGVSLGDGARVASGTISASSATPGFAGTLQVSPFSGSSTALDMSFAYTDSSTWTLTAAGSTAATSWSPPSLPGLQLNPNKITGTISSTPAAVTWRLSAGSVQWDNLATGVSLAGTASVSTSCPLSPASLCGTASGVFIGFTEARLTFPAPVGTLPAQGAALSDGSWVVARATPAAMSATGPAGSTLAITGATVTVEKGATLPPPISGIDMPDLSASSSGLGISFCGDFAVRIPYVGSNTRTGGCVEWTPDGVVIAQVGISGTVPGGAATASQSGSTVSGVTIGPTTFTGWAWTNLRSNPVATLNDVALTLARGTSELTGTMSVPGALLTTLGSSGSSIPAIASFSDSSFTVEDLSFSLDATMRVPASDQGFALESVIIHAAKAGQVYAFGLAVNASYSIEGTRFPVTLSLTAATGGGLTLNLTAMGTPDPSTPVCTPKCDGVKVALATPNMGYRYLSNSFLGAPGAHLWSITGQLEFVKGSPGFGIGATVYQDPTQLPTLLHGTTWLKGDFVFQVSEANPCLDFDFTSTDKDTYLQVRGGVFKTSTFSLAVAPESCTVGPFTLPVGSAFHFVTSLGDQSSIEIMLAVGRDANNSPTFTSHTAVDNLKLGGIDFIAMDLDISITSTAQVVTFTGDFTLPTGGMYSSFDLTANSDGSIHLAGDVSLTDWKFAGSTFDVQSFNFRMTMDSTPCGGSFTAATNGFLTMGKTTTNDMGTASTSDDTTVAPTSVSFTGNIGMQCGVLQTLHIAFKYVHRSVDYDFALDYSSATKVISGGFDWSFESEHHHKWGGHTYQRHAAVKIDMRFSMDTLHPSNDTLALSGSLDGSDISGYVSCYFAGTGDEHCEASVHIHVSAEVKWYGSASW